MAIPRASAGGPERDTNLDADPVDAILEGIKESNSIAKGPLLELGDDGLPPLEDEPTNISARVRGLEEAARRGGNTVVARDGVVFFATSVTVPALGTVDAAGKPPPAKRITFEGDPGPAGDDIAAQTALVAQQLGAAGAVPTVADFVAIADAPATRENIAAKVVDIVQQAVAKLRDGKVPLSSQAQNEIFQKALVDIKSCLNDVFDFPASIFLNDEIDSIQQLGALRFRVQLLSDLLAHFGAKDVNSCVEMIQNILQSRGEQVRVSPISEEGTARETLAMKIEDVALFLKAFIPKFLKPPCPPGTERKPKGELLVDYIHRIKTNMGNYISTLKMDLGTPDQLRLIVEKVVPPGTKIDLRVIARVAQLLLELPVSHVQEGAA